MSYLPMGRDEDIVELQVAMSDVMLVAISDGLHDLAEDASCKWFRELSSWETLEVSREGFAQDKFSDDVNASCVFKLFNESDDDASSSVLLCLTSSTEISFSTAGTVG